MKPNNQSKDIKERQSKCSKKNLSESNLCLKKEDNLPCIFNERVCMRNNYDGKKLEQEQINEFKELIRAGKKFDFGLDNERIRKELLLEDIYSALERLKDCKGKIVIQHENGIPTHMKIDFEEIEEGVDREKYKDFVDEVGFVTYKKFGGGKTKVVGEKEFKYTIRNKNKEEIPTNEDGESKLR